MSNLLVAAVRTFVGTLRQRAIDRAFARMDSDGAYQEEALAIAMEFEQSDWDALEAHGSSSYLG